jgi:hypothetical protein
MTTADGSILGTTKIVDNGPSSVRWDLVIMGDGYQSGQMSQYETDVQDFVDHMFGTPPFDELRPAINVHRVHVTSIDSGADDPTACGGSGATARTYFDASFCNSNIRRLLLVNNATALATVDEQVPQWNAVLVMVNSTVFGGAGGAVGTFSRATGAEEIALHELGHTAFGLADEYEYFRGCGVDTDRNNHPASEPAEVNVTANTNRATLKWRRFVAASTPLPTTKNADCTRCDPQASPVAAGTVGLFEGAHYYHCGAFRPEFDCKMRNLGDPFCAVCSERIRRVLAPYLRARPPLEQGVYTIQQKSNGRFADAHEVPDRDFAVVTRTAQNNDTQRWTLTPVGEVYTIQQKSNGRFMDAHESSDRDFAVVTRPVQNNDSQRWVLVHLGDDTYTIQQKSNGRFVDAHEVPDRDFAVVTRTAQNNDTQRWTLTPVGEVYTIQQKSNGRFVDAHEVPDRDFAVVTRTAQNNDSQRWVLMPLGIDTYTIQQLSSGRFVDAHEVSDRDFAVVTRTVQNNDTQRWVIKPL